MSVPINDLREMYTEVKHKNKKLKQEVERLSNELRSVRNDNELTRSAGEGMQFSEYDEESKRDPLDAANASIKEIQHSRKELDQKLRTERRHNADLQASLEEAQDAKAELERSLRSRGSSYPERSHELERRLAEKEQSLQTQAERLQEKEQVLQAREERLQKKEQSLRAQERLIRGQQSNLPAINPAGVKREAGPASREVSSMLAPGANIHTGLQNQGSRSGAVGHIKTEPLAEPNIRFNPEAIAFRYGNSKAMGRVAVEPRPPVVSRPEEEDSTMAWILSFGAELEAEEIAKADAVAKSKIPANKKIEDAAAGKKVEPGKPRSLDTPPHDVSMRKRKFEEDGPS